MKWKSELYIYYKRFWGHLKNTAHRKERIFSVIHMFFKKIFKSLEVYDKYFNLPIGKRSLKEHDESLEKYAKIRAENFIILCRYIIDRYTKL